MTPEFHCALFNQHLYSFLDCLNHYKEAMNILCWTVKGGISRPSVLYECISAGISIEAKMPDWPRW